MAFIVMLAALSGFKGLAFTIGDGTSFFSTLPGALIIVVVQNGLNLNVVSTSVQSLTTGEIILIAVAIDNRGRTIREITGKNKSR